MGRDHLRVYKRGARLFVGYVVAVVVVVSLAGLVRPTGWLRWVVAFVVFGTIAGFVVAFGFWLREFKRDEWAWRRTAYTADTSRQPLAPVPTDSPRRPSRRRMGASAVHAVGLPGLTFSAFAMLGLPSTVAGAVSGVHWLLVVGLALLVAELIDLAVIWPIRRARHHA